MSNTATITKEEKQIINECVKSPFPNLKKQIKENLYFFIRYFWDTYTEDTFVGNWHIKKLCGELEIVARRVAAKQPKQYDLIINVPPGTTKTATVSIMFPIWCWVNWYWMRFITTSHSSTLSLESAEYSRDIIRSDKFKEMFPELEIRQDKDQKSNFRVVKKVWEAGPGRTPSIKQGGSRMSTSVGAKVIGFHAHIIIPDDLIDPKAALSETMIKDANNYLDHTLSTRKVDKKVTTMVMIMQRLAQDDPTGHLTAKPKKKIRHICLPGEIRSYGEQLKPEEWRKYYIDDLLDVKRLDWDTLDDMLSDLGQYGYAGQVGQKPTPPGGGMFEVDNLQIIDRLPPEVDIEPRTKVRYWDKAATDGGGAYTAGVKICRTKAGKFIIMDVKRGQWATHKREDIIRATAEADGKDVLVMVEQEPGSGGKESAEGTIKNLAGFNIKSDRPTGDKIFRADPFSVQVNKGNVLLLRAMWNQPYVDEMENFPFSTYKDQIDASSGAFAKVTVKRTGRMLRR